MVVYDLAERYPEALIVFRVCADGFQFHTPPQVDGVVDLVLVLADRYARLAEACAVRPPLLRLRVPVDTDRMAPRSAIRARPRHAVILGNYPERVQLVREAWEPQGVRITYVGGRRPRFDIARALEGVDVVVAKSRAALDAMACGRAVYLFDMFGGDGWVTPQTYPAMERDHFAGQATDRVIGIDELKRDLAGYDPGMGMANRDLVLQHHAARGHAIDFVLAVTAALAEKRASPDGHEDVGPAAPDPGDGDVAKLRRRLMVAEETAAAMAVQLQEIRASRGLRMVEHYRRWRDRLVRRGR
jgi:hypothetical protein